eukprot:TRINITY_DN10026_c0_g5_i1.p1 TRINITY_DN10026_c0_g5~~TRINITY_DN10026_c0_g5_i1.p1  ORF type:complete len:496 (+),score=167.58 TRINITY_DN10026_c0_g5_i1:74-1561(+)
MGPCAEDVRVVDKWELLGDAAAQYGRKHALDSGVVNALVCCCEGEQLQILREVARGGAPPPAEHVVKDDDVLVWLAYVKVRYPDLWRRQGFKLAKAVRRQSAEVACSSLQRLTSYAKPIKCLYSLFIGIAKQQAVPAAAPTLLLPYKAQQQLLGQPVALDAAAVGHVMRYPPATLQGILAQVVAAAAAGSRAPALALVCEAAAMVNGEAPTPLPEHAVMAILSVYGTDKLPRWESLLPATLDWLASLSPATTSAVFERYATYMHQVKDPNKLLKGIAQGLAQGRERAPVSVRAAAVPEEPVRGASRTNSSESSGSRTEKTLPSGDEAEHEEAGHTRPVEHEVVQDTPARRGVGKVAMRRSAPEDGAPHHSNPAVVTLLSHYPPAVRAQIIDHVEPPALRRSRKDAADEPFERYVRAISATQAHLTQPVRAALADLDRAKHVEANPELLAELARYSPPVVLKALQWVVEYGGHIKSPTKFILSVVKTVHRNHQPKK